MGGGVDKKVPYQARGGGVGIGRKQSWTAHCIIREKNCITFAKQ